METLVKCCVRHTLEHESFEHDVTAPISLKETLDPPEGVTVVGVDVKPVLNRPTGEALVHSNSEKAESVDIKSMLVNSVGTTIPTEDGITSMKTVKKAPCSPVIKGGDVKLAAEVEGST